MTVSSPYAQTKHEGELLMNLYNELYKLPTVNCRFFMAGGVNVIFVHATNIRMYEDAVSLKSSERESE